MRYASAYRLVLLALVLVGMALRLAGLDAQPLWLDEAFSLWAARLPVEELPGWLARIDHHPPLYYFALRSWRAAVGESEWALRGLSALASVLTIPLLAAATRRLLGCEAALTAAVLVAVAPFQVRYAQEARMYSLVMVAVTAALAITAGLLTAREMRGRAWLGLAGSQAATMLSHHMAAVLFPLALNLGVLLVWLRVRAGNSSEGWDGVRRSDFGRRWLGAQGLALLLWSPWAWPFVQQVLAVDRDFWIPSPTVESVSGAMQALTVGRLPLWWPAGWLWTMGAVGLTAVGLWRVRPEVGRLLGALVVAPLALALLVGVRRSVFAEHALIWVMAPLLMAAAAGVCLPAKRRLRTVLLGLLLAANGLGLWMHYRESAKEPWDQVAAVVAAHAAPGDRVLFHASWVQLPFDYYAGELPGVARQGVPVTLFGRGVLEPRMTTADLPALRAWVAGGGDVWLVYSHWWYTDPDGLVIATLDEMRPLYTEWTWPGIVLRRYGLDSSTP